MAWAAFYTLRLATRNPDVSWAKKSNPEPWQEYANKQYKVSWMTTTRGIRRRNATESCNLG